MNFKKSLLVLSVVSALSLAQTVSATGVYVQAQAGMGGLDTQKHDANGNPYSEIRLRKGFTGRLAAGYEFYTTSQFSVAAELGYEGYPTNKYHDAVNNVDEKYNGYNIDLMAVGKYRFANNADQSGPYVLAKAGIARVHQRADVNLQTGTLTTVTHNKFNPKVGVGFGYDLSRNWSMDVSYNHTFGGKADPNATVLDNAAKVSATNTLLFGVSYHFA
jgi:opacity protein-like surface antigen